MKPYKLAIIVLVTMALGWALHPVTAQDKAVGVPPTKFNSLIPILNVANVTKSIEHYTEVLGFKLQWEYPNDKPKKEFASLTNGKVEIFLCEGAQGSPGTWIYYNVADIDALFKEYSDAGADIVSPPADKPWGMREMEVRDIDRHVLRIGQNLPPKK